YHDQCSIGGISGPFTNDQATPIKEWPGQYIDLGILAMGNTGPTISKRWARKSKLFDFLQGKPGHFGNFIQGVPFCLEPIGNGKGFKVLSLFSPLFSSFFSFSVLDYFQYSHVYVFV